MTNPELAAAFSELAKLMELHGENGFKIRSYQKAYRQLKGLDQPVAEMSDAELSALPGVGKAILAKIRELQDHGKMATLERYRDDTPLGVQEMLSIKGFGPKKVWTVWKDLGVESVGELLYAIEENRLLELKGFGAKTQEDLRQKLEFHQQNLGRYRYADIETRALHWLEQFRSALTNIRVEWTGDLRRVMPVVDQIELLIAQHSLSEKVIDHLQLTILQQEVHQWLLRSAAGIPIRVHTCKQSAFGTQWVRTSAGADFLKELQDHLPEKTWPEVDQEQTLFAKAGIKVVPPALRDSAWGLEWIKDNDPSELVRCEDIKGVVHTHTTYSDGVASLAQLANHVRDQGYSYLLITDHSQAAVYANGLTAKRIQEQWAAIDLLNTQMAPFKILKGTECDILADGSLDYPDELLAGFDVVIASIHSGLRMTEDKATARLLRAIEHPSVHILGHLTGRLLLSRAGYPVDHARIINACAAYGVAIELNANPARLDIDYSWIPYATEQGVLISINPDAHSLSGVDHIRYGVLTAQKGGLTRAQCLNTRDWPAFMAALGRC